MHAAEQPMGDSSSRSELPSDPRGNTERLLNQFYLAPTDRTEVNMITHPILLESYERETQMR